MDNVIKTEEFKQKKNIGKVLLIVFLLIVLILLIVFFAFNIKKRIDENNAKKELTINEELQNLNRFAVLDNYIVGINNDNSVIKIYNLLQGTGQFGDFTSYFYHDNKLYLLFKDNTIYTISLKEGNGVYELNKFYEITKPEGSVSTRTTFDLAFVNNNIVLNNSGCAVSVLKTNNKKLTLSNIKVYDKTNVNIEYSKEMKALFIFVDNKIIKLDLKTNKETIIKDGIITDMFKLENNILMYSNIVNNEKTYYGYNIKTNKEIAIVSNAKELVMYGNKFIYRTDDAIYMLNKDKKEEIYKVHYNNLSFMELINDNVLQVLDSDSNDYTKKRNINIDLKNNYKTSTSENLYYKIVEYK